MSTSGSLTQTSLHQSVSLSQNSGGVSGVLPVHPDSVVMGTIEDVIMARREEQLLRQRIFLEQQQVIQQQQQLQQEQQLQLQQLQQLQLPSKSSPQLPQEDMQNIRDTETTYAGTLEFDIDNPFATLGELGNKLNNTTAMMMESDTNQRQDTAPASSAATTTRHQSFRYDSLLPSMIRGQLSPLHDVYMSSPMTVRMKSFNQNHEKKLEPHYPC